MLVKLLMNLVLVPIPEIGVNGAAIGSVACHMVAFLIAFNVLRKNIKLDLPFKKFILKPIFATIIMAICSYAAFLVLDGIMIEKMATILAMILAVLVYVLSVVALKIFTKEEIYLLPYGNKIYGILEKCGLYK